VWCIRQFWVQHWIVWRILDSLNGGLETMLYWGPNYECNLYCSNTWPLEVVVWWFWKSSGVYEIVARTNGFWKIALLGISRRVWYSWDKYGLRFVLGNSTWCRGSWSWQIYFFVWTIRWWHVVGGVSRHTWQQRSIYVIIKGCRIKRRLEEVMKTGVWDLGLLEVVGILNDYLLLCIALVFC